MQTLAASIAEPVVIQAERVHGGLLGSACVRVRTQLHEHPFTFRYATPLRLLDVLARHGVPVDTTIHWIWLI